MPRFYLHLRDGQRWLEDPDGSDLPDLDAARAEALEDARRLATELLTAGEAPTSQRFEIVDEDGELRAVVPLKGALRLS